MVLLKYRSWVWNIFIIFDQLYKIDQSHLLRLTQLYFLLLKYK